MKIRRNKKENVSEELYSLAKAGASIHQILSKLKTVSYDEAESAIQRVAEDNKDSGPAHRANLRNVIREQATGALAVISKMAQDEKQRPEVRLRAAETMLKYACNFIDESVMRSWQERPDLSVNIQPTLFDFGPVIDESGDISFRGETRLMLVPNDNDD